MKTCRIVTVIGARPQFIKVAAVSRAIAAFNAASVQTQVAESIVHTGQHYDQRMSQVFFDQLKIPVPAVNLEVGSGPHGAQTGAMMERLEAVLLKDRPDALLVYGDTNSTLAGVLAAVKLHIPVVHVEAGLRSYNRRMPEEINRIVADVLSQLLFCPTASAVENLAEEGITRGVHRSGDVMYDSVLFNAALAKRSSDALKQMNLQPKSFYLATLHRAENTDEPALLAGILQAFAQVQHPIVLPMHPRTRKVLGPRISAMPAHIRVVDPLNYLDMLVLESNARLILTDSGGVQKEAYWLDVPCVTLREETEWVELVEAGCNVTVGADPARIIDAVQRFEREGLPLQRRQDLYGDGHAAEKIVAIMAETFACQ